MNRSLSPAWKYHIASGAILLIGAHAIAVAQEPPDWPPVWPSDTPRPVSAPKADSIGEELRTRPVVRAIVEEQEAHISGRIISRQRIEYVCSGPPELVGQTFKDISVAADFPGGRRGTFYLADPALEVGETGIWMLVPWQDTWFREAHQSLGTWWPARRNIHPLLGPNYENVRKLAEALETVWQTETEQERIELVKGFALSQTPEVSVGAIRLLEEVVPHEFQRFISETDLLNLPLRAQITIDEVLIRSQHEDWRDSDARLQLIRSWGTKTIIDEGDTSLILQRLSNAIQQKTINPETLFEILQPIVTGHMRIAVHGEPHPIENRLVAASIMRYIVNDPAVRDEVFGLLTNVLLSDEDDQLKRVSAKTLRFVTELQADQIERLMRLRDHYSGLAEAEDNPRAMVKRIAALLNETAQAVKVQNP